MDCPDRRLIRAAVECVVRELADGETEVSVLLPDRKYRGIWHRVLHDKTADAILEQLSRLPHANVTVGAVPPRRARRGAGPAVGHRHPPHRRAPARAAAWSSRRPATGDAEPNGFALVPGLHPDRRRHAGATRVKVAGRVRSIRVAPLHDAPDPRAVLVDGSASISVLFLGRRSIAGVGVGTKMAVEGTVGIHQTRLAILNPSYQLLG